jgi:hypothetical protein
MPSSYLFKCKKDELQLNSKCQNEIKTKIKSSTFDYTFANDLKSYFYTINNQDQLKFAIESIKK